MLTFALAACGTPGEVGAGPQDSGAVERNPSTSTTTSTVAPTTTTTTSTTTTTTTIPDPIFDTAVVEGLLGVENMEITLEQQAGTLTASVVDLVAGESLHRVTFLNSTRTESIMVDGNSLELDGDVWYRRPVAEFMASEDRRQLLLMELGPLFHLPADFVWDDDEVAVFEMPCDVPEAENLDPLSAGMCGDGNVIRVEVDRESNLLTGVLIEGKFETWPGNFQEGFLEYRIRRLDEAPVIEVPALVDTSRFDCVAQALGTADPSEVALLLNETTTTENQDLFVPCGWSTFPSGADLRDG